MQNEKLMELINTVENISREINGIRWTMEAYSSTCVSDQPVNYDDLAVGLAWLAEKTGECVKTLDQTAVGLMQLKKDLN